MKIVTPRMSLLSLVVLRYLSAPNGKTEYNRETGERITPTYDEAVAAARELKALLFNP